LAADLEHVLVAAEEAEITVLEPHAAVTGAEPAVRRVAGLGLFRLPVVAKHQAVALDLDLARLAGRTGGAGCGIRNAHVIAQGHRHTRRPASRRPRRDAARLPRAPTARRRARSRSCRSQPGSSVAPTRGPRGAPPAWRCACLRQTPRYAGWIHLSAVPPAPRS